MCDVDFWRYFLYRTSKKNSADVRVHFLYSTYRYTVGLVFTRLSISMKTLYETKSLL